MNFQIPEREVVEGPDKRKNLNCPLAFRLPTPFLPLASNLARLRPTQNLASPKLRFFRRTFCRAFSG